MAQMGGAVAPLIGISACIREINSHSFHAVGHQYVRAATVGAGGIAVLVPALGDVCDIAELVARFDGFLFTGSPSNVEPHHYAGVPSREGTLHDAQRDATTLPLIRAAVAAGVPVIALCRGHQELNVALGGSLHQHVHELPGNRDHRAPPRHLPREVRYGPAHRVRLTPGGLLARLAGATEATVNSLHSQAIDRLADGLVVEATAPDGVIEAVRAADAPGFVLGLQWHPEWSIESDPLSRAVFAAYGDACRARRAARERPSHAAAARVA